MTVDTIIDELESCDFYGNVGDISFWIATEDDDGFVIEVEKIEQTAAPAADRLKTAYKLMFLYPNCTPDDRSLKTWDMLQKATNVNFRLLIPEQNRPMAHDYAILELSYRNDLRDVINLCEDVAKSLRLGGVMPEGAGQYFEALFRPDTPTSHHVNTMSRHFN